MTAPPPPPPGTPDAADTDWAAQLRGVSLRVTTQRVAVLRAVHAHAHADTEQLIAATRQTLPGVSHQGVYDVLRALTDAGLVRRIQPAGSVALYEASTDQHHHAVCRDCGAITDLPATVGDPPMLAHAAGYRIETAEVFYWGRCPACSAD